MDYKAVLILLVFAAIIAYRMYRKKVRRHREQLIDTYSFPETLTQKIIEKYPHLNEQQAALVIDGLREYFHICNLARKNMVSMPSQVVDVAWHEFILFTRQYDHFCHKALGRFLHHTPAEAMRSPMVAQSGIKTAWAISCQREGITARAPERLPVLFALDSTLQIADGFSYALNCATSGKGEFCAAHIGCAGGDKASGDSDFGHDASCGGD